MCTLDSTTEQETSSEVIYKIDVGEPQTLNTRFMVTVQDPYLEISVIYREGEFIGESHALPWACDGSCQSIKRK